MHCNLITDYIYEEVIQSFQTLYYSFIETLGPCKADVLAELNESYCGLFVLIGSSCCWNDDPFKYAEAT
jgi:hypothetical protein